jgi:glycogen operon protein
VFRRKRFLTGNAAEELRWFCAAGTAMTAEQWADPTMHAIAVYLDGTDAPDEAEDGRPLLDDDFLILVNAYWEPVTFTIPPVREATQTWFVELDSYDPAVSAARTFPLHTDDSTAVRPRSLTVLRAPRAE